MSDIEKMYRYEDVLSGDGCLDDGLLISSLLREDISVDVQLREYVVKKKTAKGKWITSKYGFWKKFVRDKGIKRFAWETEEEALASFVRRKEKQVEHLERQMERVRVALAKGKVMAEARGE